MQSLYPTPKTQAERDATDAARKVRQKSRLPRLPWLTVPFLGGVIAWVLLEFMRITPEMWSIGSQAFIFFTFAMWLGACAFAYAWIRYAHRVLYAHGKATSVFWVGVLLIIIGIFLLQALFNSILAVSIAFALALFVWTGLFFVLGRDRNGIL